MTDLEPRLMEMDLGLHFCSDWFNPLIGITMWALLSASLSLLYLGGIQDLLRWLLFQWLQ